MKGLASKITVSVVAISLVVGTFFIQEKFSVSKVKAESPEVQIIAKGKDATVRKEADHYLADSGKTDSLVVVLAENVVLRLAPNTALEIHSVRRPTSSDYFERVALTLKKGRVWLNTLNSPCTSEVAFSEPTNNPLVIAEPGIFDIKYQDSVAIIGAYRRSAEVDVLSSNGELILPEGRQMEVSIAKIKNSSATLAKLRYSKLAKEFPFYALSEPDEWVLQNKKMDEVFAKEYAKKIEDDIRKGGTSIGSDENSVFFKLTNIVRQTDIALTFDSAKKDQKEKDEVFSYFDAATYALLIGKGDLAKRWFDVFKLRLLEMISANEGDSNLQRRFIDRLERFSYLTPEKSLFEIKKTIEDPALTPFGKARFALRDVFDMASIGVDNETMVKVGAMLRQFGYLAKSNIQNIKNAKDAKELFFDSVRFNDFLDKNPYLLKEEFLKISQLYERAYLDYTASAHGTAAADDQREFLIAEKLKRVKFLKGLMEKGDFQFQDTRKSILYVASQIDLLKPAISDKAVLSYFDEQLTDLGSFLSFLHSANADNMRGSFNENYAQFQKDVQQMKQVNELIATADGGVQISPYRREELAATVTADFASLNVENVKIVLPEEEGNARVKIITAQTEGKSFKATYDTDKKVFSDIEFDGAKIPNAVKLENLKRFLLVRTGKLVLPSGKDEESLVEPVSQVSILEKVAKATILESLKKLNISVDEKYLGMESLSEGIIHVRLATVDQGEDEVMFAFDVVQKTSIASGLKVKTVSGEIPVNDEFALRELPTKVNQVYQRALFEKQKEEEMKKFLNEGVE